MIGTLAFEAPYEQISFAYQAAEREHVDLAALFFQYLRDRFAYKPVKHTGLDLFNELRGDGPLLDDEEMHIFDRVKDSMIAATAIKNGMTVVTRNVADFQPLGVQLVNPFT